MDTDRARQCRADPRLILPECKSILCLGMQYNPPPPTPLPLGEGRIASYAWGDDYHDVLPQRLEKLVRFIEEQLGHPIPNRWYTDTGPILEREFAQRAGLGWIGKNTNLITPGIGSYFFLAEILLGIELIPDPPFKADHCGSCTRCIEACPTNCILPDRTIDANLCISYLTIEHKDPIPIELRPKLGNWIFGCDICQQVCPWNQRFAQSTGDEAFLPRSGLTRVPLSDELALNAQTFNTKFKGSPIKRAKRRGYLRNIAVALGNTGDQDAIPALIQALNDNEPLVRGHTAWALGQLGGKQAQHALESANRIEENRFVLAEIQHALSQSKDI